MPFAGLDSSDKSLASRYYEPFCPSVDFGSSDKFGCKQLGLGFGYFAGIFFHIALGLLELSLSCVFIHRCNLHNFEKYVYLT